MNLDLAENTNKLILLVVAGVALLLTLNTYQKQVGKNLAVVLSIVTIVVVGYVAFTLMSRKPVANNANNVNLANNLVNDVVNGNNNLNLNNIPRMNNNVVNNGAANNRANNAANNGANNAANNRANNAANNGANNAANNGANNAANNRGNNAANNGANNAANNRANNSVNNGANNVMNNAVVEGFESQRRGRKQVREGFQGSNNTEESENTNNQENTNSNSNSNHPADNGVLRCSDLLPADTNSTWAQVSPSGVGELCTKNLLNAGHHIGVNTQGCSLRNANRGLRSEPPNPQVQVSPWLQTTICPDLLRRPLE